jgi:hypothetical protein
MTGNADMHQLVTDTFGRKRKEKVGAWIRKPVSIWCDKSFALRSATRLLHIELTRLLIVAWGILSRSPSSYAKLLDIGRNTLTYTSTQSISNIPYSKE